MISQVNNNYTTPIKFQGSATAPNTKQANEKYNLNAVSTKIGDHPFSKFPTSGHYSDLKFSGRKDIQILSIGNVSFKYLSIDKIAAIGRPSQIEEYSGYVLKPLVKHLENINKKPNPDYDIWLSNGYKKIQKIEGKNFELGIYANPKPSPEEITSVLENHGALIDLEKPESSSSKRKADTLEDKSKSPKKRKEI